MSRIAIVAVLLISGSALAQTRSTRSSSFDTGVPASAHYSLIGGETVPQNVNVASAEIGWPGISFGVTHGTGPNSDLGLRFDLLYGVEEIASQSQFGIGMRVPIRFTGLRRDRMSVLFHIDPGIRLYTTSPAAFGFTFPVGVTFGYRADQNVTLAFGVDVPMSLFVTPSPADFFIAPTFGPAAELQLTREVVLGLNTRFGPVIQTAGGSTAQFGFVLQFVLGYRMM